MPHQIDGRVMSVWRGEGSVLRPAKARGRAVHRPENQAVLELAADAEVRSRAPGLARHTAVATKPMEPTGRDLVLRPTAANRGCDSEMSRCESSTRARGTQHFAGQQGEVSRIEHVGEGRIGRHNSEGEGTTRRL